MQLSIKSILNFLGIYSGILIVSNLVIAFITIGDLWSIPATLQRLPNSIINDFSPCPAFFDDSIGHSNSACADSIGYFVLYAYLATLSYVLIFIKKVKLLNWVIGFTFINFVVEVFLILKNYLYLYM